MLCVRAEGSWSSSPVAARCSLTEVLESLDTSRIPNGRALQRDIQEEPRPKLLAVGPCADSNLAEGLHTPFSIPSPAASKGNRIIVLPGVDQCPLEAPACAGKAGDSWQTPGYDRAPAEAPSAGFVEVPMVTPNAAGGAAVLDCAARVKRNLRWRSRHKNIGERWWLEYDPPKANYISSCGRGPHGGHSINKADWPRQMLPIKYEKKWERRESNRFAFRKHGYELDVPKWGG